MTTIFQVIKNIKHNGTYHNAGEFIEAEVGAFGELIELGFLKIIDGAKSIEHAQEIIASEKEQVGEQVNTEKEKEPENTWGPKQDEDEEEKTDTDDAPKDDKKEDENKGADVDAPKDETGNKDLPPPANEDDGKDL